VTYDYAQMPREPLHGEIEKFYHEKQKCYFRQIEEILLVEENGLLQYVTPSDN